MDEAKERVYWTDLSRNVVESAKWSGEGHRIIKENVCKFFKYSITSSIIDMNSDNLITVQINTPFFFKKSILTQVHTPIGLALSGDWVLWLDTHKHQVIKCNKFDVGVCEQHTMGSAGIALIVQHRLRMESSMIGGKGEIPL